MTPKSPLREERTRYLPKTFRKPSGYLPKKLVTSFGKKLAAGMGGGLAGRLGSGKPGGQASCAAPVALQDGGPSSSEASPADPHRADNVEVTEQQLN